MLKQHATRNREQKRKVRNQNYVYIQTNIIQNHTQTNRTNQETIVNGSNEIVKVNPKIHNIQRRTYQRTRNS